jgi:hypothetical protein
LPGGVRLVAGEKQVIFDSLTGVKESRPEEIGSLFGSPETIYEF